MNFSQLTSSLANGSSRTRLALRVAMWSMAISVSVVTLSELIVAGFRSTIQEKLTSLVSFAHITENNPIFVTSDMAELDDDQLRSINGHIYPQRAKAVVEAQIVAQHSANTLGLMVIGAEGDTIADNAIRMSKTTASLLDIEVGDQIDVITFVDEPKRKALTVSSIYSSDIVEIESAIAYVSMTLAREFSLIDTGMVSYYRVENPTDLATLLDFADEEGLKVMTAQERVPHIYSWLSMIDQNMTLILIIMIVVAIINVVTASLIAIVDNMAKIGTLRALGMRASTVRKLFVVAMGRYVLVGTLFGLAIGLLLGAVQYFTGVITLDSSSYFLSQIPIDFDPLTLALYVVIIAAAVVISILLPVSIISKLSIASTIKYE